MNNKTCGECKHFEVDVVAAKCEKKLWICDDNTPACKKFERKPFTNGDVIRQMSNAELAKLIVPKVMFCDGCPVKCAEKDIPQSKVNPFGADVVEDVCTKRVESWLNAQAESEGKDE